MTEKNEAAKAPAPSPPPFHDGMGDFFDRLGQPRIAGRLFGHLLVCSPPEQNAAQLQEAVGASAGSVSTMIRMLRRVGLVDARGERGGRRRWYRIAPDAFSRTLSARVALVSELRALAEEGLDAVEPGGEGAGRLEEMRDFYAFFEQELPALIERYQASRGGEE